MDTLKPHIANDKRLIQLGLVQDNNSALPDNSTQRSPGGEAVDT